VIISTLSLPDENTTARLGARLGTIAQLHDVICLTGPLGSGKSTFARALIRELACTNTDVPSPTFTLVETYNVAMGTIHHFDLYRLEKIADAHELGIEEAMDTGICLIEWAERIVDLLPPDCLIVSLNHNHDAGASARTLTFTGPASWQKRLVAAELTGKESDRFGE